MPDSSQNLYKKLLGKKGEKLVLKYLKKQGCKILKKNYATPFGEADLIVQDGDEIAFVEVKTRTSDTFGAPREAVGTDKQRRYRQIAKFFWKENGEEPNARFDVAEVFEDGNVEYFKYAF
ncbi:MAG: YraN family protein [Clostridiales bacterium]|nr:YraN family protein [Clostridiales bacterium]MBQ2769530.1 YraN family protein [Clostridia bacterium]